MFEINKLIFINGWIYTQSIVNQQRWIIVGDSVDGRLSSIIKGENIIVIRITLTNLKINKKTINFNCSKKGRY